MFIFTDAPKILIQGVQVQQYSLHPGESNIYLKKSVRKFVSIYGRTIGNLARPAVDLQWIEEKEIKSTVIASDTFSASSIRSGRSSFRIFLKMYRIGIKDIMTRFVWVPAHGNLEGNEQVDILAKQALRVDTVDIQVP